MGKINVYYKSHQNYYNNNFENKIVDFINKRLSYFFSDYNINISPYEELEKNSEGIIVILSLINPIIDEKHLKLMIQSAIIKKRMIKSKGEVPGTSPDYVSTYHNMNDQTKVFFQYSNMQATYNSQLNLSRMKRVIIFDKIINIIKDFYKWPLIKILDYFSTKEGIELILSYTSTKKMKYFNSCPYCKNKEFHPINLDDGNPVTGFLTKFSNYYYQCEKCSLVYLNPALPNEELYVYYDQYSYEIISQIKSLDSHYNNLSRETVSTYFNFLSVSTEVNKLNENSRVLDIGGGIGEYCVFLRKYYPSFEINLLDFRIDNKVKIELSKHNISSRSCDFLKENFHEKTYDLISNWEVIEHLPINMLESYFIKIRKALNPDGIYVLSTPDFSNIYTKALGFWAAFPGEHLSVFSRESLEPILNNCGLSIIKESHECVTLDSPDRWFSYGYETNSTLSSRAQAAIINDFLKSDRANKLFRDYRIKNNIGSELILCLKKSE